MVRALDRAVGIQAGEHAKQHHAGGVDIRVHAGIPSLEQLRCKIAQHTGRDPRRLIRVAAMAEQAGAGIAQQQAAVAFVEQQVLRANVGVRHVRTPQQFEHVEQLFSEHQPFGQRQATLALDAARQVLTLMVRQHGVKRRALSRNGRQRPHQVGAVDTSGDPFLAQKAVNKRGTIAEAGVGKLEQDFLVVGINRAVEPVATAFLHQLVDAPAVHGIADHREGQHRQRRATVPGKLARQTFDAHHAGARIVGLGGRLCAFGECLGHQLHFFVAHEAAHEHGAVEGAVHAVRGQGKDVAFLEVALEKIRLDLRHEADGAAELRRLPQVRQHVIARQELELVVAKQPDTGIAGMSQQPAPLVQQQRGQRRRQGMTVSRQQELVGGGITLLKRFSRRPDFRCGTVALDEYMHGGVRRTARVRARRQAVGEGKQRDLAFVRDRPRQFHQARLVLVVALLCARAVTRVEKQRHGICHTIKQCLGWRMLSGAHPPFPPTARTRPYYRSDRTGGAPCAGPFIGRARSGRYRAPPCPRAQAGPVRTAPTPRTSASRACSNRAPEIRAGEGLNGRPGGPTAMPSCGACLSAPQVACARSNGQNGSNAKWRWALRPIAPGVAP